MSMLESAATTLLGSPHHDGSELYVVDALRPVSESFVVETVATNEPPR